MPEYISIKNSIFSQLEKNLPELPERFGIETTRIFGSGAREDDVVFLRDISYQIK